MAEPRRLEMIPCGLKSSLRNPETTMGHRESSFENSLIMRRSTGVVLVDAGHANGTGDG